MKSWGDKLGTANAVQADALPMSPAVGADVLPIPQSGASLDAGRVWTLLPSSPPVVVADELPLEDRNGELERPLPWPRLGWAEPLNDADGHSHAGHADHGGQAAIEPGGISSEEEVFQQLLCIEDEPGLHWIAEEMAGTLLPPDVWQIDLDSPGAHHPLVLEALEQARAGPPLLYGRACKRDGALIEVTGHPYMEVFEQAVALAALVGRSAEPCVLIEAAQEAWTSQHTVALTAWREDPDGPSDSRFVHLETGKRSVEDPRQPLLRELQLGCRIMAMIRARAEYSICG